LPDNSNKKEDRPGPPVSPLRRRQAIEEINYWLTENRKNDLNKRKTPYSYLQPPDKPEIFSIKNPSPYTPSDEWKDDPLMELAVQRALEMYPAARRVGAYQIGRRQPEGIGGQTMTSLSGHPFVTLGQPEQYQSPITKDKYGDAMNLLRHELGHVMGLGDNFTWPHANFKRYGSYDLGSASDDLHRDIELPKDELSAQLLKRQKR
jgi:hypothetical protein